MTARSGAVLVRQTRLKSADDGAIIATESTNVRRDRSANGFRYSGVNYRPRLRPSSIDAIFYYDDDTAVAPVCVCVWTCTRLRVCVCVVTRSACVCVRHNHRPETSTRQLYARRESAVYTVRPAGRVNVAILNRGRPSAQDRRAALRRRRPLRPHRAPPTAGPEPRRGVAVGRVLGPDDIDLASSSAAAAVPARGRPTGRGAWPGRSHAYRRRGRSRAPARDPSATPAITCGGVRARASVVDFLVFLLPPPVSRRHPARPDLRRSAALFGHGRPQLGMLRLIWYLRSLVYRTYCHRCVITHLHVIYLSSYALRAGNANQPNCVRATLCTAMVGSDIRSRRRQVSV